jgi:hypothetical protein
MAEQIIKTATAADEASIIAVVLLAFSADPAARWAWPDPQQYLRHFPNFVKALGGKAFAHGSAYYVDGYAGAAMWLPPEVHPDEDTLVDLLQRTVYAPAQKDVFAVFEQMARYHPQEPHWFRTLAYLESSNPKNIPLYERYGFELLGTIQVGTSPPVFPMLRKPRE